MKAAARVLLITPRSTDIGEAPVIERLADFTQHRSNGPPSHRDFPDGQNPIIAPPVGIYLLQQYLHVRGIPCDVFNRDFDDPYVFLAAAQRGEYDIIGFGVTRDNVFEDLELLWHFRDAVERAPKPVLIMGGGAEAALNWRQWLQIGLDLILLGFAQKSLTELAYRVHAASKDVASFQVPQLVEGMQGVAYLGADGQDVFVQGDAIDVAEFERLFYDEVKDYNGLPYERYWEIVRTRHANTKVGAAKFVVENARLYTSSHCPRKCGFCNTQSFLPQAASTKQPIIVLSAEHVADLIRTAARQHGARSVSFNDDDFLVGNKPGLDRAFELCERILGMKERGEIPPDMRFNCQTRSNNFLVRESGQERRPNHPLMSMMKRAGFNCVSMGVETFIDRIMKTPAINKLGVDSKSVQMVINGLLENQITPQINLILGVPEYTAEELADNMELAFHFLSRGCDVGVQRKLLALPGAPIFWSGQYHTIYKAWRHPRTGQEFQIADYFLPDNPAIRHVVENCDDITGTELRRIREMHGWGGKLVHRRVVTLTSFIAVARLLGREDLAERYRAFIDAQVARAMASAAV